MNILVSSQSISMALQRCMRNYRHYFWSVAWAGWHGRSAVFKEFDLLARKPRCFKKIIIGTHFSQTHPQFINQFRDHDGIRFFLANDDLFHPKVYYFENDASDWACIIGSANFTASALTRNVEVCALITSADPMSDQVREDVMSVIDRVWLDSVPGSKIDLEKYTKRWKEGRKAAGEKATPMKKTRTRKALVIDGESTVGHLLRANWAEFRKAVTSTERFVDNGGNEVIEALSELHQLLRKKDYLSMSDEERKKLLGTSGNYAWLGDMKRARIFMRDRDMNAKRVSAALAEIPLDRKVSVTKDHYDAFLHHWRKIPHAAIGVATRLLAVRRPDVFCSVNGRSKDNLSRALGKRTISLDNYWDDCIGVLHQSAWWNAPRPANARQATWWDDRMALIDFLVCEE